MPVRVQSVCTREKASVIELCHQVSTACNSQVSGKLATQRQFRVTAQRASKEQARQQRDAAAIRSLMIDKSSLNCQKRKPFICPSPNSGGALVSTWNAACGQQALLSNAEDLAEQNPVLVQATPTWLAAHACAFVSPGLHTAALT